MASPPPKDFPASWSRCISDLGQNRTALSVLTCGPKNAGKSTFVRCLVDSLLQSHDAVALLDTDCGQSMLTPPGILSLHLIKYPLGRVLDSPDLRIPERAYYVGDSSPRRNPEYFMTCIAALVAFFEQLCLHTSQSSPANGKIGREGKMRVPLVINTHGWVKGTGIGVIWSIVDRVHPSDIVDLRTKSQSTMATGPNATEMSEHSPFSSPSATSPQARFRVWELEPFTRASRKDAPDLRSRALESYFSSCFGRNPVPSAADCLSDHLRPSEAAAGGGGAQPYRVRLSSVRLCIMDHSVPPDLYPTAMNGTLVGLGVDSRPAALLPEHPSRPSVQIMSETPLCRCVGLGIIQAIDMTDDWLYIVAPLPPEEMGMVNTLLRGSLNVPTDIVLNRQREVQASFASAAGVCRNDSDETTPLGPASNFAWGPYLTTESLTQTNSMLATRADGTNADAQDSTGSATEGTFSNQSRTGVGRRTRGVGVGASVLRSRGGGRGKKRKA